jgi:hypothetical protein
MRNGVVQSASVDLVDAAVECTGRFTLDGVAPEVWDKIAGLYRCGAADAGEWVRLHTNFAHHRDGVLRLLGLPEGPTTTREQVAAALAGWNAADFEERPPSATSSSRACAASTNGTRIRNAPRSRRCRWSRSSASATPRRSPGRRCRRRRCRSKACASSTSPASSPVRSPGAPWPRTAPT